MQINGALKKALRWVAACVCAVLIVMFVRAFCLESYRVSTKAMEESLYEGDYILVNKWSDCWSLEFGKVALFTSPLAKDSIVSPLFISRCVGMPGDTILVNEDGYSINGKKIPHSPLSLRTYFVAQDVVDTFRSVLRKLDLPERDMTKENFGYTFSLTSFEEYLLREELTEDLNRHFVKERMEAYKLIVPQSNYWMLSDNVNDAVDSRHLGFVPKDHIIGTVWYCWYSPIRRRVFKPIY